MGDRMPCSGLARLWSPVSLIILSATFTTTRTGAQSFPEEYSFSSAEARQRNTLLSNVSMVPRTIQWQKWAITVGDAWLEKSKDGGCYLCFRIATGREAFLHGAF